MRGSGERIGPLFSYVGVVALLRPDHLLRAIWALTDEVLKAIERKVASLYSGVGRRRSRRRCCFGHAPAGVLCAPSQLMERIEFDLLFRCFVGLGVAWAEQLEAPAMQSIVGEAAEGARAAA